MFVYFYLAQSDLDLLYLAHSLFRRLSDKLCVNRADVMGADIGVNYVGLNANIYIL